MSFVFALYERKNERLNIRSLFDILLSEQNIEQ